ncbi:MAG: Nramp family divalent metal transporter [Pseudomonadales bacterium]
MKRIPLGPGALVAAAFIGPGTVTACTLAGANFGYALMWALLFATLATIVLQDMAARLGAGAQLGLGEAIVRASDGKPWKWPAAALIFTALAIGNSAYEAGNLAGGALGIAAIVGEGQLDHRIVVAVMAILAIALLAYGRYQVLEKVLVGLVLLMSAAFLLSATLVGVDFVALLGGLKPQLPKDGVLTAVALIGTTIVPYNLFLHAAAARQRWPEGSTDTSTRIREARVDTAVSIGLGGLVSIFIVATAAAGIFQAGLTVSSAADLAMVLEPGFGQNARYLLGTGLFAAGLTSALTAPMATAFVLNELRGAPSGSSTNGFRLIACLVVLIGAGLAMLGLKPLSLILIAQTANGLLLPIIAVFLLFVMNNKALLGSHANGLVSNIAGVLVIAVTLGLGLRAVL